jgi:hypothetical protein
MAVQAQWELFHTAKSTVELSKDFLSAVTTDNVQALAVLACEQFGTTIAMSQETILKINKTVVPRIEPAYLRFAKSSIGYSANDCIAQLGANTAGLHFLALGASLVTSMSTLKSSMAIHAMLASAAKDKRLLPTPQQVNDLLNRIEPRCHASGFADDMSGWERLLQQSVPIEMREDARCGGMKYFPECQGIGALVDAFRQLRRLGNEDITKVTIRTTSCAVWTIAFAKWSLGHPPSIMLDDGTPILEQEGSQVVIILTKGFSGGGFNVTIHSSIDGPSDLVDSRIDQMVAGMVSLRTYGDHLKWHYGFHTGEAEHFVQEALPYAICRAVKGLVFSRGGLSDRLMLTQFFPTAHQLQGGSSSINDGVGQKLRLSPFPDDNAIIRLHHFLFDQELELLCLEKGLRVIDLPPMKTYLSDLEKECNCNKCQPSSGNPFICKRTKFLENLSVVVADILALSLFNCPEALRVSNVLNRPDRNNTHEFVQAICHTLESGAPASCTTNSLLDWVLRLAGHDMKRLDGKPWVMSSFKGQTIWPTLYETNVYTRRGYLSLSWLPGLIRYKNMVFNQAVGPTVIQRVADPVTGGCQEEVLGPRNLCPEVELEWNVAQSEDGIVVSVGVNDDTKKYSSVASCPTWVIANLAEALLAEECSHSINSDLDGPDHFCVFTGPLKPVINSEQNSAQSGTTFSLQGTYTGPNMEWAAGPVQKHSPQTIKGKKKGGVHKVSVVAVDGRDDLRFLALSNNFGDAPVVLRRRTCLACSLDACRRTGSTVLVL